MAKRNRDQTACAVPAAPDPRTIRDEHAETVVLCGLMREPDETRAGLAAYRFDRTCFYSDPHGRLYDAVCYVLNGPVADSVIVDVYRQVCRRARPGWWLDTFATPADFTAFLLDAWFADPWLVDMTKWADPSRFPDQGQYAWAALAAAAKLRHMAARRQAVYAANELLRDALDPVGDADSIQDRIDNL